jgi:hypothetical protein
MFLYKIENNTSNQSIISDNEKEIQEYKENGWLLSEIPIIWKGKNAKKLINGEIADVEIEITEEYKPTKEELIKQKYREVNSYYNNKLKEIENARLLVENSGLDSSKLILKYKELQEELKLKLLEVYNGKTIDVIK